MQCALHVRRSQRRRENSCRTSNGEDDPVQNPSPLSSSMRTAPDWDKANKVSNDEQQRTRSRRSASTQTHTSPMDLPFDCMLDDFLSRPHTISALLLMLVGFLFVALYVTDDVGDSM